MTNAAEHIDTLHVLPESGVSDCAEQVLSVREINTLEEWLLLEPEWNSVVNRSGNPSLYQTFDWLSTWWKCHQSEHRTLTILIVSNGDVIIGLAPLMNVEYTFAGFRVRKLEFISMAKYAYSAISYAGSLDFIITERHGEVLSAMFRHLAAHHSRWQYLRLHPIPVESLSLQFMQQEAVLHGWTYVARPVLFNAVVTGLQHWETYFATLSGHFRKSLRKYLRKIQDRYTISISVDKTDQSSFSTVMDIENESWKSSTGVSILSSRYRGFYRELFERAARSGWLRLATLSIDGESVAYDFGVEYANKVEILKGSFKSRFKDYSVGKLLMMKEIETFAKCGVSQVNLLWGDLPYKLKWTSSLHRHDEVYIFGSSTSARLLHLLYIRIPVFRIVRKLSSVAHRMLWKIGIDS